MLTIDRAEELLAYDADTGVLRWRKTLSNRCVAGNRAGTVSAKTPRYSNRQIRIDGKLYREHRLIWFLCTGEWPPADLQIDHINGNPLDNRWRNLRLATNSQNQWNRDKQCNNTSGHKGVWRKGNRWAATIWVNNKKLSLGSFASAEEAGAAYRAAAAEHHRRQIDVLQ
jgi:hypothetical protein